MEPVYKPGFEPHNRRYQSHFDLMQTHTDSLIQVYMASVVGWSVCLFVCKMIRDWRMNQQLAKNPQSHWQHIKELSSEKKWLHASYFYSIIHALTLCGMSVYSSL